MFYDTTTALLARLRLMLFCIPLKSVFISHAKILSSYNEAYIKKIKKRKKFHFTTTLQLNGEPVFSSNVLMSSSCSRFFMTILWLPSDHVILKKNVPIHSFFITSLVPHSVWAQSAKHFFFLTKHTSGRTPGSSSPSLLEVLKCC